MRGVDEESVDLSIRLKKKIGNQHEIIRCIQRCYEMRATVRKPNRKNCNQFALDEGGCPTGPCSTICPILQTMRCHPIRRATTCRPEENGSVTRIKLSGVSKTPQTTIQAFRHAIWSIKNLVATFESPGPPRQDTMCPRLRRQELDWQSERECADAPRSSTNAFRKHHRS